jgi:large subunit ribosomal protein L17
MRHGRKINHLSRKTAHRKAMLANMSCSLILHKRINTTVAKAKALRKYVEPLLTKSKDDSTASRRTVFSYLNDKEAVTALFKDVAVKIADRPGGYTRIIKTGNRLGDNAEMCLIELVDFNELMLADKTPKKAAKPATRRGKKKATTGTAEGATESNEEAKPKAPKAKKAEGKKDDSSEEKTEE